MGKITGYRELSTEDINMINEIKSFGLEAAALIARVDRYLQDQENALFDEVGGDADDPFVPGGESEYERIQNADAGRWLSMGKTKLQQGFMAITRAVAQPGGF